MEQKKDNHKLFNFICDSFIFKDSGLVGKHLIYELQEILIACTGIPKDTYGQVIIQTRLDGRLKLCYGI